ncbi:hypothetical protein SAMN05444166_1477 [Singulisphaera sp. GP187]|uniref:hypothetical protein n=1 Tax=Singulisphaera sp. GP187 TaxID=1882752 RepID=UPI00092C2B07|nr:hypothetical protein [Singulisphaera sp. GP187]SIN89281.1 hypothetical protein SAMN05444166_1477 [Singulisphaera sp. GP187]
MQCSDFERQLNEQFDARDSASPDLDRALEAHAAGCATCQLTASRYQMLRQVLQTVARPPAPPVDFLPHFLESQGLNPKRTPRRFTSRHVMVPLAMAASLFWIVFLGWPSLPETPAPLVENQVEPAPIPNDDPPLLTDALASAGSATWNFAIESSEPAARIGREFLDAASFRETAPGALALTLPNSPPPTEVLESVGDRVNAQVRPFSGTARHAFGFLLGPSATASNGG